MRFDDRCLFAFDFFYDCFSLCFWFYVSVGSIVHVPVKLWQPVNFTTTFELENGTVVTIEGEDTGPEDVYDVWGYDVSWRLVLMTLCAMAIYMYTCCKFDTAALIHCFNGFLSSYHFSHNCCFCLADCQTCFGTNGSTIWPCGEYSTLKPIIIRTASKN